MDLDLEIKKGQLIVKNDSYTMSMGEIINLYKNDELIINPEFQRLFRWTIEQKSKLIESILLGIPIPSIFVFETDEGKWELVDGLQRMATIFEFTGVLRDHNDEVLAPSTLVATPYLPSLQNVVWDDADDGDNHDEKYPLSVSQQLSVRRARITVEILKRPSDKKTKYDLFQRLNTGGSPLNPQELRNCLIVMENGSFLGHLRELAECESFKNLTQFNEEQLKAQKDIEFITRYFVYRHVPFDGKLDVEDYIDQGIIKLASKDKLPAKAVEAFRKTFSIIEESVGVNGLKQSSDGEFKGRIGFVALEIVAVGISFNLDFIKTKRSVKNHISKRIHDIWSNSQVKSFSRAGLRGTQRIAKSIPFGKEWFSK